MKRFEKQVALVTGAGSGIGQAIALALAREGAVVCLVDVDAAKLEAVVSSSGALSSRLRAWPVDITEEKLAGQIESRLSEEFGRLDVLVHSAGTFRTGSLAAMPVEDFDLMYRVNVRAPYRLTQALLGLIKKHKGQIVFINSSAGLIAGPGWGAYSATKAALKMVADSLRAEVNAEGIRVISVYPGRTASPMQSSIHRAEGKSYNPDRLLQPQDIADMVMAALALPKTAEVTDLQIRPMMKPG